MEALVAQLAAIGASAAAGGLSSRAFEPAKVRSPNEVMRLQLGNEPSKIFHGEAGFFANFVQMRRPARSELWPEVGDGVTG